MITVRTTIQSIHLSIHLNTSATQRFDFVSCPLRFKLHTRGTLSIAGVYYWAFASAFEIQGFIT